MEGTKAASRVVFPKAPIVEALLDIGFEPSTPIGPDVFEKYHELVKTAYPTKKEVRASQADIELSQGLPPKLVTHKDVLDGCHFLSDDKKQIVQVKMRNFTANRLSPYESWEKFQPETQRLWGLLAPLIKQARIRRVGLRYINRVEVPLPVNDLREYILTLPDIPAGLPQAVSEFFMRMVVPDSKREISAAIYHTIEHPKTGKLPVIFDIDVSKTVSIDLNDKSLWTIVEQLREYKNEIFFHSLTDKAKELFK